MTILDNVKPGQGGIIRAVGGRETLRRRLLNMGLTPRTNAHVDKVAPVSGPAGLDLRGYVLTLRPEDTTKIKVNMEGAKRKIY